MSTDCIFFFLFIYELYIFFLQKIVFFIQIASLSISNEYRQHIFSEKLRIIITCSPLTSSLDRTYGIKRVCVCVKGGGGCCFLNLCLLHSLDPSIWCSLIIYGISAISKTINYQPYPINICRYMHTPPAPPPPPPTHIYKQKKK